MLHRRFFLLLVAVGLFLGTIGLLLGMVGPARFLPAYKVQAQDVRAQDVGVTLDGPAFTATVSTGSVISVAVTTGSGDNRLMLVSVYYQAYAQTNPVRTINAVSFTPSGGVSTTLTRVGYIENGVARQAAIYAYLGPPISTSGYVTVSFTASVSYGIIVGVANFKGVDQATPLGTYATAVYSDTSSPTTHAVTVTTAVNDLVYDTVALFSALPVGSLACDGTQTQLWNELWGTTIVRVRGATSTKLADTTSTVMTWTASGTTTTRFWAMGAVPIHPAAVGATHALTVTVDPTGSGTTNPSAGTHTYAENSIITVTATANTGYNFDHWGGDCSGSGACVVTLDADKSVTATFAAIPTHTLTVAVDPSGGGTTNPAVGAYTYFENTVVTVTAAANVGYTFDHWAGDCSGSGACVVTMDADKSVTATFAAIPTYTLTLAVDPAGGGTTNPAVGAHTYYQNTVVTVTAAANVGYVFGQWEGDCSGSGPCVVTMDADKIVTATFTATNYDLTMAVSPTGGGTTDPAVGVHSYGAGAVVNITATASSGYLFQHWTGDVANANSASTTVTMDAAKAVTASFLDTACLVQVDGAASSIAITSTVSNAVTLAHTTGSGANRMLLVGVSWNPNTVLATISSVTFSYGEGPTVLSLTEAISRKYSASARYAAIWYSPDEPPAGQTGTVTVNFTGTVSNGIVVGAANFAQVDQANPIAITGGADASSSAPSVTLSGLDGNELVVDTIFAGGNPPATLGLTGTNQTQLAGWNQAASNTRGAGSTEQATGSSVTMSWVPSASGIWVLVAAAIRPAPCAVSHTLTVAVDPVAGGTTDPAAGDHDYAAGTVVTVTATPSLGYTFSSWSGACTGSGDCQVTMDADKAVTATFATSCYTLTLGHSGNGTTPTASPTHSTGCPAGQYVYNESIDLSGATPDTGWEIANWYGTSDDGSTGNTNSLIMPASDHAAGVNYVQTCYHLSLGHTGNGTDPTASPVSSPGCPGGSLVSASEFGPATNWYVYGETITLSGATPDTGWEIASWTGTVSDTSKASTNSVTMPASDHSASVNYTQSCYTLTLSHAGNGATPTASPTHSTGCSAGQYHYLESISLSGATPDTGWEVASWTGTISDTSKASTNTVTMPAGAHSASVNYAETCYALTLGHTGTGTTPTASPTNSTGCSAGQYHYLESISLSGAAPATGWGIFSWTGTISDTSKASTNTVTMPASAHAAGVNYLRLLGDVNNDGLVNSTDALIVLSADAAIPTTQFCPMNYGDVNGDGLVNSTDALIILSYDAAMSVPFPLGQPRPEPVLSTQPPGCGS